MIIDGHAHLFHPKVIFNVNKREELVKLLGLKKEGAENRVGVALLDEELKKNGVGGCFVLPTALPLEVSKVNDSFYKMVETSDLLHTAGTLNPEYAGNKEDLLKFKARNIRGIKLCSFFPEVCFRRGRNR